MDTIDVVNRMDCTGCGSCISACPVKCINMEYNPEGFLMPQIDHANCIKCGRCLLSCPIMYKPQTKSIIELYGGYHLNRKIVLGSSSGGAFYRLSKQMIDSGGAVCAAAIFPDSGHVCHRFAYTDEELKMVMKSKYVQSDVGDCFIEIKNLLEHGKGVLFCGTPCQIAGIKAFLKRDYDLFIAVEFICHGVPSPIIWEEYLGSIQQAEGLHDIKEINFRDKKNGWHNFGLSIKYGENGGNERFRPVRQDIYYNGFLENLFLRQCCYQCKFKGMESAADISLADFWNCENRGISEKLNGHQWEGVSLIIVFSDKGINYLKSCREGFYLEKIEDIKAVTSNIAQIQPAKYNKKRHLFYKYRKRHGTYKALQKYATYTFGKKLKNHIIWKYWKIRKRYS